MKQVCLVCERTSPGWTLFCPAVDCPAERSPLVFEPGDRIADLEIARHIATLRSAGVYEALRGERRFLLKIAQPGGANTERLKREAVFLRQARHDQSLYPTLPRLCPPHAGLPLDEAAYGTTMVGETVLYFYLAEPFDGETLQDWLLKQPQWWANHVGWLTIDLATTLNSLHLKGLCHYALTPASVLVRFDREPHVPRILLIDLGLACDPPSAVDTWYDGCVLPAYTAPELLTPHATAPALQTDVYGLGLVLYEMLVGQPAFPYRVLSDADVLDTIRRNQRVRMGRVEDVASVAHMALQATSPTMSDRQPCAADLAEQLVAVFGEVPPAPQRSGPRLDSVFIILAAVLAAAFLMSLALALQSGG